MAFWMPQVDVYGFVQLLESIESGQSEVQGWDWNNLGWIENMKSSGTVCPVVSYAESYGWIVMGPGPRLTILFGNENWT